MKRIPFAHLLSGLWVGQGLGCYGWFCCWWSWGQHPFLYDNRVAVGSSKAVYGLHVFWGIVFYDESIFQLTDNVNHAWSICWEGFKTLQCHFHHSPHCLCMVSSLDAWIHNFIHLWCSYIWFSLQCMQSYFLVTWTKCDLLQSSKKKIGGWSIPIQPSSIQSVVSLCREAPYHSQFLVKPRQSWRRHSSQIIAGFCSTCMGINLSYCESCSDHSAFCNTGNI